MSTLKNKEALNKMIQGTHKSQTRTVVGFSDVESKKQKSQTRKVGEIWTEKNPITGAVHVWEQKNGFRVKQSVGGKIIGEAVEQVIQNNFSKCYDDCDKRKTRQYTVVDHKLGVKTQMCTDCLAKYETRLRYQGKGVFDEYAKKKIYENAQAFLITADKEVEDLAKEFEQAPNYVTVDGAVEKWTAEDPAVLANKIRQAYNEYKQQLIDNLQNGTDNNTDAGE